MSGLSKEQLLGVKQDALAERQKHIEMVQQANGAIAMLDFLLAQCEEETPEDKENS